jgi:hypothetical protein
MLVFGAVLSAAISADAQHQSCVDPSTWPVQGGFAQLIGSESAEVFGTGPDIEARLLPPDAGSTSNAFNFFGRLQDVVSFQVDYEVYNTGSASAIYFYFGGQSPPASEDHPLANAFTVAIDVFTGKRYPSGTGQMVVARQPDLHIFQNTPFTSTQGSWIPMRVTYLRSGPSITVLVTAQGTPMLTTVVDDASEWLVNKSGTCWGIAARNGAKSGTFSFRGLAVQASNCTYLGLACLPGSLACTLDRCGPGTYSTSPGKLERIVRHLGSGQLATRGTLRMCV